MTNTFFQGGRKIFFAPWLQAWSWILVYDRNNINSGASARNAILRRLHGVAQGRTEVRWCPGQETSLALPCSNLRSFGSKFTVLKKKLVTLPGLCRCPPSDSVLGAVPPSLRPWCCSLRQSTQLWNLQNPECRATYLNRKISATLVRPCVQNVPG